MTTNATKAYSAAHQELLSILEQLEDDAIDNGIDCINADWGHVGSAVKALELAKELRDHLRGTAK